MKSFKTFMSEARIKPKRKLRVPRFKNEKQVYAFLKSLGPDDAVKDDVVHPETGEVLFEPGETKREIAKKKARKDRKDEKLWIDTDGPMLLPIRGSGDWDGEIEFLNFYRVIMKSISDEVEDPEQMMAGDYDVSYEYPKYIKRKDSKPFNENDKENIGYYMEYYGETVLPENMELHFSLKGKNLIEGEIYFK